MITVDKFRPKHITKLAGDLLGGAVGYKVELFGFFACNQWLLHK